MTATLARFFSTATYDPQEINGHSKPQSAHKPISEYQHPAPPTEIKNTHLWRASLEGLDIRCRKKSFLPVDFSGPPVR